MTDKRLGFGFLPQESMHHFAVLIKPASNSEVIIYERFSWDDNNQDLTSAIPKASISKIKWKLLEETLISEFSSRLSKKKVPHYKKPRFIQGLTPLEALLGKELLVLIWAVEDCADSVIPPAIRNWLGLAPEERWWLYTMTNAATGNIHDKTGWRKALRYALTENPILEKKQRSLFELGKCRNIKD